MRGKGWLHKAPRGWPIWKALTNYYKSTSDQNQNVVYCDFITFPYRDNVSTFMDDLDSRIRNIASTILQKLPEIFLSIQDILCQSKTPLTIASVKEALDGKRRQSAVPVF
ncbi:uncharacterized protein VP01_5857g2 [Puccinia sorghi]|uniref:Uncharacterized protein n=1 Tax=Puccinia sorghi TaxID=27349 RepID=A0A0L6UIR5_9BASI|nr:uncharacterized protein VP01_5857g2 [Puccinia sorghi]